MTKIDKIKAYAKQLEKTPVSESPEVYLVVLTHLRTIGSISKYIWDMYYAKFYPKKIILNEVIAGLEQKRFKINHATKHYKGHKGHRVVNYSLSEETDWSIIKRPLSGQESGRMIDINRLP
jgi:hypothetical protein